MIRASAEDGRASAGAAETTVRGPPVIGLGDHVPAFLLREVKLPKRATRKSADDPGETAEDTSEAA
jgi:hypothetical protein